jgi:pyruvate/2-oxoglutarate dehydrogenase complex dihydrolipoamide acyltransferase (E2) component
VVVVLGGTTLATSSSGGVVVGGVVVEVVVVVGGVVVVGATVVVVAGADAAWVSDANFQSGTVLLPGDETDGESCPAGALIAAAPVPLCITNSGTTSRAPHNASAAIGRPFD